MREDLIHKRLVDEGATVRIPVHREERRSRHTVAADIRNQIVGAAGIDRVGEGNEAVEGIVRGEDIVLVGQEDIGPGEGIDREGDSIDHTVGIGWEEERNTGLEEEEDIDRVVGGNGPVEDNVRNPGQEQENHHREEDTGPVEDSNYREDSTWRDKGLQVFY